MFLFLEPQLGFVSIGLHCVMIHSRTLSRCGFLLPHSQPPSAQLSCPAIKKNLPERSQVSRPGSAAETQVSQILREGAGVKNENPQEEIWVPTGALQSHVTIRRSCVGWDRHPHTPGGPQRRRATRQGDKDASRALSAGHPLPEEAGRAASGQLPTHEASKGFCSTLRPP